MPQFFITEKNIINNNIIIDNVEDIKHISGSLRCKIGEVLNFCDGEIVYKAEIKTISKKSIELDMLEKKKAERFVDCDITLATAVIKKYDIVVQKATELGVNNIIPLKTENTTVPNIAKKSPRWQKIALESSKQCERANIPEIREISTLEKILKKDYDLIIFLSEREREVTLRDYLDRLPRRANTPRNDGFKILVIIGPEGGWSDDEIRFIKSKNIQAVSLGKLILRAETAVICAVSNIIYEYG